jgi:hypothetical protein
MQKHLLTAYDYQKSMPKKSRRKQEEGGLNRKQIIGLILIFIFIVSTLAFAAIQSGI